jgi:hypothetical protein
MNSYRNAEIEYRERCKARIQRQLEISEENLSSYCVVDVIDIVVSLYLCCLLCFVVVCLIRKIS